MRNLLGVLAGAALLIGIMGVAHADTGCGEWGTAYYDQVIDDHSVNYMSDYSPALDGAVDYKGCSDCGSGHKGCSDCGSGHKGCGGCGSSHGAHAAQPAKGGCSSCGGGHHDSGCSGGGCGTGSGNDIIGYGSEDWDWYTI